MTLIDFVLPSAGMRSLQEEVGQTDICIATIQQICRSSTEGEVESVIRKLQSYPEVGESRVFMLIALFVVCLFVCLLACPWLFEYNTNVSIMTEALKKVEFEDKMPSQDRFHMLGTSGTLTSFPFYNFLPCVCYRI